MKRYSSVRYELSVCPEQCFPEDMIADVHRICAELRTMVETLSEIDETRFRQTIAILRSSASRMTAAAKRERNRNEVLSGDRRIDMRRENSGLCRFHEAECNGVPHYLNPDCPVCEWEIDRQNNEASQNESESDF